MFITLFKTNPQPRLGSLRTAFGSISVRTDPTLGSRGTEKAIPTFLVKIGEKGCPHRDRGESGSRLGRTRCGDSPNAVAGYIKRRRFYLSEKETKQLLTIRW